MFKTNLEDEKYMKIWSDKEVESLFKCVEKHKENKASLKFAFETHAKEFKRKPNSVRNYYYKEVDNLMRDKDRCKTLGIDLEKHTKNHFVCFEKHECENFVAEIEKLTSQGMSVRSACCELAKGDLSLMTRLQNKYQNLKKNNIIQFRRRKTVLSDNEIYSLFMGLVKLIKKSAVDEVSQNNENRRINVEMLMKKSFDELNEKDKRISDLSKECKELRRENQEISMKLKSLERNASFGRELKNKHISKMIEN